MSTPKISIEIQKLNKFQLKFLFEIRKIIQLKLESFQLEFENFIRN